VDPLDLGFFHLAVCVLFARYSPSPSFRASLTIIVHVPPPLPRLSARMCTMRGIYLPLVTLPIISHILFSSLSFSLGLSGFRSCPSLSLSAYRESQAAGGPL